MIMGVLASIILIFLKNKSYLINQIFIITIFLAFIFPLILDVEQRHIVHIFPFLLINMLYVFHYLYNEYKKVSIFTLALSITIFFILSVNVCINYLKW